MNTAIMNETRGAGLFLAFEKDALDDQRRELQRARLRMICDPSEKNRTLCAKAAKEFKETETRVNSLSRLR